MNTHKETTLDNIINSTMLDLKYIITGLESIFEISKSDKNLGAQISSTPSITLELPEEQSTFEVILNTVPQDNKLSILKLVRAITSLGLKESKEIVDNVPKIIKDSITKEEASNIQRQFEEAGATAIIK